MDEMNGVRVKEVKGKAAADYCVESKTELKDAGVVDAHTLVPNKHYRRREYDLFTDLAELPEDHPLRLEVEPIVRLRVEIRRTKPPSTRRSSGSRCSRSSAATSWRCVSTTR